MINNWFKFWRPKTAANPDFFIHRPQNTLFATIVWVGSKIGSVISHLDCSVSEVHQWFDRGRRKKNLTPRRTKLKLSGFKGTLHFYGINLLHIILNQPYTALSITASFKRYII